MKMNNKVFIAMPSWRDPFVYETIRSAYEQAYDKESLTFGVFFQGYPEDDWMIDTLQDKLPGVNIKIKKVHGDDAPNYLCEIKGAIVTEFLTDEEYYMQVDCHTKFRKNWDLMLKTELAVANKVFGKSIINSQTIYFNYWSDPLIDDPFTAYASMDEWMEIANTLDFEHPISLNGRVTVKPKNTMIREKFYNGNMVFAPSSYIKEVPFPNKMAQCFEQQLSMLRAWTAGYDVISPIYLYTNNFNYWKNSDQTGDEYIRHVRWDLPEQQIRTRAANKESYEKYISIFTNPEITYNSDFGAFKARTIEDYIDFIKYDPVTLEIKDSTPVDMNNAIFISNELFAETMQEISQKAGYGIINPSDIVNDPHVRR